MTIIGGTPLDQDGCWICPTCGHREHVGGNLLKALNAAGHVAVHLPKGR